MSAPKLTKARREALEVLAAGDASYSNITDAQQRKVYWQSADWLIEQGLAVSDPCGSLITVLTITDAGRELLEAAA